MLQTAQPAAKGLTGSLQLGQRLRSAIAHDYGAPPGSVELTWTFKDGFVPHDVAEERMAAALAAGGHLVSDARAKAFWILADVEGNEACICTWQDRDHR